VYPYAEVDGRPHEDIDRRSLYRDIETAGSDRPAPGDAAGGGP
jgi:hypothetical protein